MRIVVGMLVIVRGFVQQALARCWLRCPLIIVAVEVGGSLWTCAGFSAGQVVMYAASMALHQVEKTGKKSKKA